MAVGHQILEIAFYIMRDGVTYEELGADLSSDAEFLSTHLKVLSALRLHKACPGD